MEALINPSILKWARNRASESISSLAKRIGTAEANIEAWENGEKKPSFNQALKYAEQTYIPFGYLFLESPPEERLPIPDLRTVNNSRPKGYSLALIDSIRWALERQSWYRDYLTSLGVTKNPHLGKFNAESSTTEIIADIRSALKIPKKQARGNYGDYFSLLVKKIEEIGILVMRNSVVNNNNLRPLSVEEFRGFAINDPVAPVIFINTADCPEARLFTLAHELAHIWIGESGVSDAGALNHRTQEQYCNAVAAELLVPGEEFLSKWTYKEDWRDNMPLLAKYFHVSEWVTARRALTFMLITHDEYNSFIAKKIAEYKAREKKGKPTYSRLQTGRVSRALAQAVASETLSGRMLYRDAHRLIGIKPQNLSTYAKKELGL